MAEGPDPPPQPYEAPPSVPEGEDVVESFDVIEVVVDVVVVDVAVVLEELELELDIEDEV